MSESSSPGVAPPSLRSVPRGVWVGGGLLGLVAAALAGALIMKSAGSGPSASAVPSALPAMSTTAAATPPSTSQPPVGQPVPLLTPAPVTEVAKAGSPAPANASPAPATTSPRPSTAAPLPTTRVAVCATCGVIESVTAVKKKGPGTGVGAVAGGVVGGVVGHQLGGGSGKTALTVLGAVGGGFAGHEIEKRARSTTVYDVRVRMDDGSTRVLQRAQSMAVGTRVTVQGSTLKVRAPGKGATPRPVPTSTPSAGSPA